MNERFIRQAALIGLFISLTSLVVAQPSVVTGGVLNAASFAKDGNGHGTPVAPGSLVSIFGNGLGTSQADADTVPFSANLGGVSATFNNIAAPLRDVIPAASLVNAQIPFDVLPAGQTSGTVNLVVNVNGTLTAPQPVQIVPQAPGIFTFPSGVGTAILVNLTDDGTFGSIAAPVGSISGFPTSPISRGNVAYMYATGLGIMTPPVNNGDAASDGKEHDTLTKPQLFIGGKQANVLFSGQSGYPGVYQINLQIPTDAPTGDKISVRLISSDGTQSSPDGVATISIR